MFGFNVGPCLTVNKFGCYIGPKDAKCWYCQPEPTKLDRVFIVTSIGANNVSLHKQVSS